MKINYRPITEKELNQLQEATLLDKGIYPFEILEISQKKTQSGKDMLVVDFQIWDQHGVTKKIRDWIVLVDELDLFAFKLRHFADSCSLLDKYENNDLDLRDFLHKKGMLMIDKKDNKEGNKTNFVKDYVKKNKQANIPVESKSAPVYDDSIPF